jgi:hypothetical protein
MRRENTGYGWSKPYVGLLAAASGIVSMFSSSAFREEICAVCPSVRVIASPTGCTAAHGLGL